MKHAETSPTGRVYDETTHQWVEPVARPVSKSKAKRHAAQTQPAETGGEASKAVEPAAAETAPQATNEE